VKSKALANIQATATLLPDGMMNLRRDEQVMLEMQSSLSLNTWMDAA